MKKKRRHFTAEEKVTLLRSHLVEEKPVSEICLEHHLEPTVFYRWQQEFFENGTAVFQRSKDAAERRSQERIAYLENRVQRKDEVLAELMMEHVALKRTVGTSHADSLNFFAKSPIPAALTHLPQLEYRSERFMIDSRR